MQSVERGGQAAPHAPETFGSRRQIEDEDSRPQRGRPVARHHAGRSDRAGIDAGPDDVVITRLADGEITALVTESTLRDEKGGAK